MEFGRFNGIIAECFGGQTAMNNSKIVEYEKRMMQLRLELDEIVSENGGNNSPQMQDKLNFLSVEMMHMSKQLEYLKQESVGQPAPVQQPTQQPVVQRPVQPTPVPQTVQQPVVQKQVQPAVPQQQAQPVAPQPSPVPQPTPAVQRPVQPAPAPAPQPTSKSDLEGKIGKSWMGVFASVLVFISVVMFAAVIIPNLTDAMKMAIMFVFSFGLTAVSLFLLLGKNSENKLYLALTGCGVGCVYISLIVSSLYFKIIGPYILFILLFIWSAGICLLLRYKNILFTIIGQIGVTIAIIIGCAYSVSSKSLASLGAVLAFLVLTQIMFFITLHTRSFIKSLACHIVIFIGVTSIVISNYILDELAIPVFAAVFVCILVYLICTIFVFEDETGAFVGCNIIPHFLMLALAEAPILTVLLGHIYVMLTQVVALALVVIACVKKKNGTMSPANEVLIKLVSAATVFFIGIAIEYAFAYVVLLAVFYLVLGIIFDDSFSQYVGIAFAFLHGCALTDQNMIVAVITAVVVLGIEVFALVKDYHVVKKILTVLNLYLYIIALTVLTCDVIKAQEDAIYPAFVIVAIVSMFIAKLFDKDLKTGEKEDAFTIFAYITNAALLFISLPLMYAADAWHLVIVLVAFALLCLNALWQLRHKSVLMNIYVAIKYTIYIVAVLGSFDVESIWISAALLLFAIACIIIGYTMDRKGVRIYGLVIANLSVAKLVLIDISYKNTLEHALSFLGCGVLCFVISFIYTIIEKKDKLRDQQAAE